MSMLGARQLFRSFRKSSPALPYDAEVKWLESTGTQWIDTGVSIARNLYCEVSFCLTVEPGSYDNAPFGANNRRTWLAFASRQGTVKVLYCGMYSSFTGYYVGGHSYVIDDMDWHVAKIDSTEGANNASFQLDDNEAYIRSSSTGSVTNNMYLFGCNGTGITNRAKCRIGYCKIKSTTTNQFLLDLIPVRFTNELGESEGAMYDRISGQLLRNQGTGKFIVGADEGMPYDREVAYVQYHSTNFDSTFSIPLSESVLSRFRGKNMDEIDWSAKGTVSRIYNGGNLIGIGGGSAIGGVGPYMAGGASPPSIYAGVSSAGSVVCQTLDDYHSVSVSISSGVRYGQIDGGEIVTASFTTTAAIVESTLVFFYASKRSGTQSGTKFRQSDVEVKIGDETVVDGRPVVTADGAIGWYDYVSRQVYSAPSSTLGLSAGPVVSNEGPRPYAYKVQYIETDGVASYIDTGVEFDPDVRLLFNLAFVGAQDSHGGYNIIFFFQQGWSAFRCGSDYIAFTSFSFDTSGSVFYECEIQYFPGDRIAKVDGTTVGTSTTTTAPSLPGATFVIGARNLNGTINRWGHVKCAKFQIFDHAGNCKFNGIPVVDRNGVACMYDYISKTLKYNAAATGTITAGPPLV